MATRNEPTPPGNKIAAVMGLFNHDPSLQSASHIMDAATEKSSKGPSHRVSKNKKYLSSRDLPVGGHTRPIASHPKETTELTRKANSSTALEPANHLTGSLKAIHEELLLNAVECLSLEEQASSKRLVEIASYDTEKFPTRRTPASEFSPFHLEVTDKDGDSVRDLRGITGECQEELNTLAKEWMKAQRKIACLGIEVMGPKQFTGLGSKRSGISKTRLNRAISAARARQEAEKGAKTIHRIKGEEIQRISREATSEAKTQGKVRHIPIIYYYDVYFKPAFYVPGAMGTSY